MTGELTKSGRFFVPMVIDTFTVCFHEIVNIHLAYSD
jgi:hypothetical protein